MSTNGKTTVEEKSAQLDHGKRTCAGGTRERVRTFKRVVVLALTSFVCASVAHASIPASERAVLQNIYTYTDGGNWFPPARAGWNGAPGTECQWHGIECNVQGNSVIAIRLAGSSLFGSLPPLSALPNLEVFDVRAGAPGGFTTGNELRGTIPPLSGLRHLKQFRAGWNVMTGSIPPLAGLSELQVFECYGCGLDGTIPSLNGLVSLETFNVKSNQLSGPVPELSGLQRLSLFYVADNHLTGPVPDLTGLQSLDTFFADGNLFSGSIPAMTNLPNLRHFWVNDSLLDGTIGSMSTLPSLVKYDVSQNLLTGSIPQISGAPRLQEFRIYGNDLSGGVPDLSGHPDLQEFSVAYNRLEGQLPTVPPSLVAAANANGGSRSAWLCPNLLTPASEPPSSNDIGWNIATMTTPWSQGCASTPPSQSAFRIVSNRNPATVGQPMTLTAVVRGMNPTGTFTFLAKDGTAFLDPPIIIPLCENVPLINSVATCTVSNIPASGSTYILRGSYSGDAENLPFESDDFSIHGLLKVRYGPITMTTTANPAQVGEPVDIVGSAWPGDEDESPMFFYDGRALLCANVPVHAAQRQKIGHCVTHFTTPGPHSLIVSRYYNNYPNPGAGFIPLIQNVVAASPFDANQFGLNGSWYNPVTTGQGLQLQVYPNHVGNGLATLAGNWNTYDASGNQQWYPLQGDLSQAHGASFSMAIGQSIGGNFNAAPMVQATAIGSATMTFHDCTHATFAFSFNDGRSGTIPYVRLTDPTACSAAIPALPPVNPPEHYNDLLHSGIWYDPATSGQGLMVEIVPSMTTFFAAWSTYAPQSVLSNEPTRQRWFSLQDNHYTPGDLSLDDVPIILTTGGRFNEPSAVEIRQVGSADIDFTSCSTMTLHYTFTDGEFSGLSGSIDERAIVPHPDCR